MVKPKRPETTLFLNLSVDGRITSHDSDSFDPDKLWKDQPGIRGILQQFYEFQDPNLSVLTTGVVMKNVGVNTREGSPRREQLTLVVLDPDADLTPEGVAYLSQNIKQLYLVCLKNHTIFTTPEVKVIAYPAEIDLNDLFTKLYRQYHLKHLLIHSIAPLNADLLDAGLIDHLSVVVSPLLVGGHGTPALQDTDLFAVRELKLVSAQTFSQNFINLRYNLVNR